MKELDVIVLDAQQQFLEYTHPAVAKKLIKDGKATIYSKQPFAIQLNSDVSNAISNGYITLRNLVF